MGLDCNGEASSSYQMGTWVPVEKINGYPGRFFKTLTALLLTLCNWILCFPFSCYDATFFFHILADYANSAPRRYAFAPKPYNQDYLEA